MRSRARGRPTGCPGPFSLGPSARRDARRRPGRHGRAGRVHRQDLSAPRESRCCWPRCPACSSRARRPGGDCSRRARARRGGTERSRLHRGAVARGKGSAARRVPPSNASTGERRWQGGSWRMENIGKIVDSAVAVRRVSAGGAPARPFSETRSAHVHHPLALSRVQRRRPRGLPLLRAGARREDRDHDDFADMPKMPAPADGCEGGMPSGDGIMHACLALPGGARLMAGDAPAGMPYEGIKGAMMALQSRRLDQAQRRVPRPLARRQRDDAARPRRSRRKTFGMLTDKFGVSWAVERRADSDGVEAAAAEEATLPDAPARSRGPQRIAGLRADLQRAFATFFNGSSENRKLVLSGGCGRPGIRPG